MSAQSMVMVIYSSHDNVSWDGVSVVFPNTSGEELFQLRCCLPELVLHLL